MLIKLNKKPVRKLLNNGVTLTEAVVSASLLFISIVPMIKGLTSGQVTSRIVQQKTQSLALAQLKLDEIRTRSISSFSTSFSESSVSMGGGYRCTVTDDGNASLKEISVSVGFDNNSNNTLDADEKSIVLKTLIAKRSS
jgi:hypothetical protein